MEETPPIPYTYMHNSTVDTWPTISYTNGQCAQVPPSADCSLSLFPRPGITNLVLGNLQTSSIYEKPFYIVRLLMSKRTMGVTMRTLFARNMERRVVPSPTTTTTGDD